MAGSGAIGKPGLISSPNHGSSSQTICGDAGSARRHGGGDGGEVGAHGPRRRRRRRGRPARRRGSARRRASPGRRTATSPGRVRPRAAAVARNVRMPAEGVVAEVGGDRGVGIEVRRRRRRCCRTGRASRRRCRRAPGRSSPRPASGGAASGSPAASYFAQGEGGGVVDRAVGQAADAGGRTGAQAVAERRHGARRDAGRRRLPHRQVLRPSSSRSSPAPDACPAGAGLVLVLLHRPPADGSHGHVPRRHVRRSTAPSANLHAVPDSLATSARAGARDLGRLTLWGARLAWLAVAVVGGEASATPSPRAATPVQLVATIGAWIGVGRRRAGARRPGPGDADGGPGGRAGSRRRRRRRRWSPGADAAIRARAWRPGARRRPSSSAAADTGRVVRAGVGVRRRAALPAATAARLPRRRPSCRGRCGSRR